MADEFTRTITTRLEARKKRPQISRGFSLLEIIIVLAIMGIILVTVASYARKMIDERHRQLVANAAAQDVADILRFVNADHFAATVTSAPITTSKQNVINPLYQQGSDFIYSGLRSPGDPKGIPNNPLWRIHSASRTSVDPNSNDVSPYFARVWSQGYSYAIQNRGASTTSAGRTVYNHPLNWSTTLYNKSSVRGWFSDSSCNNNGNADRILFDQPMVGCTENPILHNSELAISRIDFINSDGTLGRPPGMGIHDNVGIDRVDVYVSYHPRDSKPTHIQQYFDPLMQAFSDKKISPNSDEIYLVMRTSVDNAWTLLDKTTGRPIAPTTAQGMANVAKFGDLPELIRHLRRGLDQRNTYGIRFSFDGKEGYLRSDGVNAANKICWNTEQGIAAPCIQAPAEGLLTVKRRDDPREFADLQVKNIVLKGRYLDENNVWHDDFYTASQTQYVTFRKVIHSYAPLFSQINKGTNQMEVCYSANHCIAPLTTDQIMDPLHGALEFPLQTCPRATDESGASITLYPRISASISSAISTLQQDGYNTVKDQPNAFLRNPSRTLDALVSESPQVPLPPGERVTVNRLGGSVVQIQGTARSWRIGAMLNIEENSSFGHAWQYYNPPGLSLQLTMWCSSNRQPR